MICLEPEFGLEEFRVANLIRVRDLNKLSQHGHFFCDILVLREAEPRSTHRCDGQWDFLDVYLLGSLICVWTRH
jgi:hypothetical protein